MASIREELVLADKFSATFNRYATLGTNAANVSDLASRSAANYQSVLSGLDRRLITLNSQFSVVANKQAALVAAGKRNTAEFANLEASAEKLGATIRDLQTQYGLVSTEFDEVSAAAREAAGAQNDFAESSSKSITAGDGLAGTLKRLAGGWIGLQGVKALFNLSDTMAQTSARLNMVNEQFGTTADLSNMVYAAAQKSRGAYGDMADFVGKLGTLAPDAFSGPEELVAFAEQINKQYALAGTSSQGAQAATLQLTQALSSGVLRGEELNSVLEQAPTIVQTIGDYLGKSTGEIRELASEGKITSEIVKNAILGAADETNAKFEQMPMTWSQVWTKMKNTAIMALQPVLNGINWLANNIEKFAPVLVGATAAVLAFAVGLKVQAAATWIATGAAKTFFATLLTNPLTYIAIAIGLVVYAIYEWVKSVGGLEVAWLIAVDKILYGWDTLKLGFMTGIYAVQNWLDDFGLAWMSFGIGIQDWMGDAKVNVLTIIQDMVNGAIDIINGFSSVINTIFGTSFDPIEKMTFATTAAIKNEAEKQARANELALEEQMVAAKKAERAQNLAKMELERNMGRATRQLEIKQKQDEQAANSNGENWIDSSDYANDMLNSVNGIGKEVSAASEDLKSLVDMAERRYVNNINLTTKAPVINIQGQNTGNTTADARAIADTIKYMLIEQTASSSNISTATPT